MLDRIDQVFELDRQQHDPTRARRCQVPNENHGVLAAAGDGMRMVCTHRYAPSKLCTYEEPAILYPATKGARVN